MCDAPLRHRRDELDLLVLTGAPVKFFANAAHALTRRLQPSPTTVKADDEHVGQCVWPYCNDGYGGSSIRKGHVVAEVNWSGGRAWVHAYHLGQFFL